MHKVVRRVVTAAPAVKTATTVAPTTRLRFANPKAAEFTKAQGEIREQLKLIADADAQIDAAMANKEAALAKVEELMRSHRITTIDNGILSAVMVEGFTRQVRTVDPKAFRAKVSADTFWACVSVNIAKAEEYMGTRELNGIADVKPSKSTGFTLKVKELKGK